ncbi:small ubiquitin-related modifier 2-A-like [Drosophila innubila]|uniref:small ubiquitin-related modifier 2-A-like n=1 Tax=Drosophila innubila TaxID=198719 RepID=UPI00148CEB2B|nr:small ubiquitin-related modifier 2-A-like [Drosophila innubila]
MSETEEVQVSPHITLKVQSVGRGVVPFRIRRTMPLVKLRDAYCSQMGLCKELTFMSFDGDKIDDTETADSLLLEQDDMLEVFVKHQVEAGDGVTLGNNTLSA